MIIVRRHLQIWVPSFLLHGCSCHHWHMSQGLSGALHGQDSQLMLCSQHHWRHLHAFLSWLIPCLTLTLWWPLEKVSQALLNSSRPSFQRVCKYPLWAHLWSNSTASKSLLPQAMTDRDLDWTSKGCYKSTFFCLLFWYLVSPRGYHEVFNYCLPWSS